MSSVKVPEAHSFRILMDFTDCLQKFIFNEHWSKTILYVNINYWNYVAYGNIHNIYYTQRKEINRLVFIRSGSSLRMSGRLK